MAFLGQAASVPALLPRGSCVHGFPLPLRLLLAHAWPLTTGYGVAGALLLLLTTLFPLRLSTGSRALPWGYRLAAAWALSAATALGLSLLVLESGAQALEGCWGLFVGACYSVAGLTPFVALLWVAVCCLQLHAPRSPSLALELLRASVAASLPAALIGWAGLWCWLEVPFPAIPFLAVPPPLAVAGTLIAACLAGALRWRWAASRVGGKRTPASRLVCPRARQRDRDHLRAAGVPRPLPGLARGADAAARRGDRGRRRLRARGAGGGARARRRL